MLEGVVKWFHEQKGYGFIVSNNKEYFFHYKDIDMHGFKTVNQHDKVQFKPEITHKGNVAKGVVILAS